ncbi:MAG: hypothetical protein HYV04_09075 [Deltaproteobacteria bacterium]|nr:hypothetical protein [Deltaproteobacteria bacterium]
MARLVWVCMEAHTLFFRSGEASVQESKRMFWESFGHLFKRSRGLLNVH